ncbi:MAG TPA: D-2-hydroxyacid dehydrogenase [Steroidobacteraceae bacterium]
MLGAAVASLATFAAGARAGDAVAPPAAVEPAVAAALVSELGLHAAAEPVRERSGWRPARKILIAHRFHDDLPALQLVAPQVQFIDVLPTTPAHDMADADVAIGICDTKILQVATRLQWIQWPAAGVERCVREPLIRERRPLITNMQRVLGASMAEYVLGTMLVLSRHLDYFFSLQQRGHWPTDTEEVPQSADLQGKTVLVVGLGGIGTEVAKRAYAFGMRVTATRASGSGGPDYVSYVGPPADLMKLAPDADFVVNCTPLTPQTAGLFNKTVFDAMKPTAYFINVGRGGSVVTPDLIGALRRHQIAGAGLDVTDPEPLPADNALWHLPNVLITPHVSANTPMVDQQRVAVMQENLRRYMAGEPMLSVVDIDRGY